jgi:hypothetical protein
MIRVRYKAFVGWTNWVEVQQVQVQGEVLVLTYSETREDWVPLGTIRGPIEIDESDDAERVVAEQARVRAEMMP